MKSAITRNGIWSSLLLLALFGLPLLFVGIPEPDDFMSSEVVGHVFILISLVFVVFGMIQYKNDNGGKLNYWQAVKTGVLIAIFPAVTFGLYNLLYVEVLDPEFMAKYAEHTINLRSEGKTAAEALEIKSSVEAEMEMFSNPAIQFAVMFLSVFIMGTILSLIAAFFVKSKNQGSTEDELDGGFVNN